MIAGRRYRLERDHRADAQVIHLMGLNGWLVILLVFGVALELYGVFHMATCSSSRP